MTFEEDLLEAVDEGLSLLGESAKQTILFYLKNDYSLCKQDIPHRMKDFTVAIEEVFGRGAEQLEIKILKKLFYNMGYAHSQFQPQKDLEFIKYIEAARTKAKSPLVLVTCAQQ